METRTYSVIIEPAIEGGFWAYVPALPGCFTQGETLDETAKMAQEAVEGFLEVLAEKGEKIPVEKHYPQRLTLDIEVKTQAQGMIRLPTLNARKLIQALKRAGFEEVRQRGSHLFLWHSEKRREICVPVHGKDLGRNLVRAILQQAGLTEEDFWQSLNREYGSTEPFFRVAQSYFYDITPNGGSVEPYFSANALA